MDEGASLLPGFQVAYLGGVEDPTNWRCARLEPWRRHASFPSVYSWDSGVALWRLESDARRSDVYRVLHAVVAAGSIEDEKVFLVSIPTGNPTRSTLRVGNLGATCGWPRCPVLNLEWGFHVVDSSA
jgi:hypothetical protein